MPFSFSSQETVASTPVPAAAPAPAPAPVPVPVQINTAPVAVELAITPTPAPVAVAAEAELVMSTPTTPALDSETMVNDSGEEQAHSVSSSIQEKDPEVSSSGIVEESAKQEILAE